VGPFLVFGYTGSVLKTGMYNTIPEKLLRAVAIADTPSGLKWLVKRGTRAKPGDTAGYLDKHHGYWVVRLDGKSYRVNRVVCCIATGEDHPELEVAHNDNDKTNNSPDNLRWATRSENERDKPVRGKVPFRNVYAQKGKYIGMWRVPGGEKRYCGRHDAPEQAFGAVESDKNRYYSIDRASPR